MYKRVTTIFVLAMMVIFASAADRQISITLKNASTCDMPNFPFLIALSDSPNVASALVMSDGKEIPCQLDDTDGDGKFDELFALVNLPKKSQKTFQITLSDIGTPRAYEPKVYVDMMLTNSKIKESNKQNLYISQLTVDRGVNPYSMLHHHGAAFENELVAYRIYFDHRQTVDIYGKYKMGLELKETQFYPDKAQAASGYGDDVLWVGNTLGVGTLRGWDGQAPTMISDVEHRSQRLVARGPLRTIVEVKDEQWRPQPDSQPTDMVTYYTLYAGRRDCRVDVFFNREVNDLKFATGLINVKNSVEHSDHQGLRGCWGTDWPVSEKDSAGHKRETVGLGICLYKHNVEKELPANKDNYPFVIKTSDSHITYRITFGSDNESFGFHNAKDWFAYLEEWKKSLVAEDQVKVQ